MSLIDRLAVLRGVCVRVNRLQRTDLPTGRELLCFVGNP